MSDKVITKNTTSPAFWMQTDGLAKFYDAVRGSGGDLRAVGGAVRDFLLKRPITDIDFACNLLPDDIKKIASDLSAEVRLHGFEHGTVMIILHGRAYEVTSLRKDIRTDGRHAEVEFGGDWQTDAMRRDFTINAMSMDAEGIIYDYCGGLQDLQEKKGGAFIKFVGDASKRIQEDYLRILRFLRFFATLENSHLDETALPACEKHTEALQDLSVERRRDEFLKLLAGEQSFSALQLMEKHGILQALNLPSPPALPNFTDIKGELRMNFYLSHFAANNINGFCQEWRLPNQQSKFLTSVGSLRKLLHGKEDIDYLLQRHGSEAVSLACLLENDEANWRRAWDWQEQKFPLNGDHIKNLLNCEGREVGDYLDKGLRHWLSRGRKIGAEELSAWYKTLAKG